MTRHITVDDLVLELIGDDERGYNFITDEDILALKSFSSDQGVLSLYLDTRPERLQVEPMLLRYKNLIAPVRERIHDRNELLLFDAVTSHIGKLLEHHLSRAPQGRGLAIFAAPYKFSPKRDREVKYEKFLIYHLPEAPVDHLDWGKLPVLTPLLIQIDEHEPTGVVLADRRRARFFVYYMGEAAEYNISEVDETPSKTRALGWGAHNHEQWQEEHWRQHFRNVVEWTELIDRKAGWKWLVLAGPDEIPAEIADLLPKSLRSKLLGLLTMPLHVTYNDVRDRVAPLVHEAELREERERLEALVGELERSNGRAVAGLADTTLAVQQGRIDTLFFPPDLEHPGWQCRNCQGLIADLTEQPPASCIYCGSSELDEVPDVVTLAAEQTLHLGGRVEVVRDENHQAILKTHGNIAALLRF
jgi:peptide subunit release factor 1 (eRF1)